MTRKFGQIILKCAVKAKYFRQEKLVFVNEQFVEWKKLLFTSFYNCDRNCVIMKISNATNFSIKNGKLESQDLSPRISITKNSPLNSK